MQQLQLMELNAAIDLLEKGGGVSGGCMLRWQWPLTSVRMGDGRGGGGEGGRGNNLRHVQ